MSTPLAQRLRLIVITDVEMASPRSLRDVVRAAVDAGAPAVQLRAKNMNAQELVAVGQELLPFVREAGALFFVNDRVDVALAIDADGVHVGPDDVPVRVLRPIVPRGFLIGASTSDPDEARRLVAAGADYIGCGTIYPTMTKADAGEAIGLEGLHRVVDAVDVPVVGIGGIDVARASEIAETGAAGVAAVAAVMGAQDITGAVWGLQAPWRSGRRLH